MKKIIKLSAVIPIIFLFNINYINIYGFQENFEYCSYSEYDVEVPYRIYIPADYETNKYPVVLYLHGAGERGSDNEIQLLGAPYYLFANGFIINNPAIVIAPQCPDNEQWVDTNWTLGDYSTDTVEETAYLRIVYEILLNVIEEYNADTNRIYITGLSMGGYGTWDMLVRYPDMFAAAIPISGAGDSSKVEVIKDIPIWAFHCEIDPVVPISGVKKMMEAFRQIESDNCKLTVYEYAHHDAWTQTYKNEDVLKWLFTQVKSDEFNSESTVSGGLIEHQGYSVETAAADTSATNIYGIVFIISAIIAVAGLMVVTVVKIVRNL